MKSLLEQTGDKIFAKTVIQLELSQSPFGLSMFLMWVQLVTRIGILANN
jgi:hypothetical protein